MLFSSPLYAVHTPPSVWRVRETMGFRCTYFLFYTSKNYTIHIMVTERGFNSDMLYAYRSICQKIVTSACKMITTTFEDRHPAQSLRDLASGQSL